MRTATKKRLRIAMTQCDGTCLIYLSLSTRTFRVNLVGGRPSGLSVRLSLCLCRYSKRKGSWEERRQHVAFVPATAQQQPVKINWRAHTGPAAVVLVLYWPTLDRRFPDSLRLLEDANLFLACEKLPIVIEKIWTLLRLQGKKNHCSDFL